MTKQDARNKDMVTNAIMKYMNANGKEATLLDAIKIAEYIHRAESTLSRLAEMECDSYFYGIYWKDGVNPKQERTEERIEKYIKETIGCDCYTQRDPRGYCVRLKLKCDATENFFNSWDGETTAMNW